MKDVPGYEGLYKVTEDGEVWSCKASKNNPSGRWLTRSKISGGYWGVSLYKYPGPSRCYGVHRIVAWAYVANLHNKPYVNHIDYNKTNNHYSNLEWVTPSENVLWSAKIGSQSRKGSTNGHYKYPAEVVKEAVNMRKNGSTRKEIQKKLGISSWVLSDYLSGKARSEDSGVKADNPIKLPIKTKLTVDQVLEIRDYKGKITLDELVKKLGICKSTVSAVRRREIWKNV
jgi:hypothetical protein